MGFTLADLRYSPGIARYQEPEETPHRSRATLPVIGGKRKVPTDQKAVIAAFPGTLRQAAACFGVSVITVSRCRREYGMKRKQGRLFQ